MTGNQPEDQAVLAFLDAQRDAVFSIVEGLDEEAWHRSVVPSGWTPAGLVEHLGGAERHWFQGVVAGSDAELPWDEGLPPMTRRQRSSVTGPQRRSPPITVTSARARMRCWAVTPLSVPPRGRHGDPQMDEPPSVRWVVLHMIEETARHAGHLDIARELIDGQTGLEPR